MANVVGDEQRNSRCVGEGAQLAIHPLLVRIEMTLEIDEEIAGAEDSAQAIGERARILATNQRARNRTARTARETNQACAEAIEIVEADAALALGRIYGSGVAVDASRTIEAKNPALGGGEHPAQILVALAIGDEDVKAAVVFERQVGADDRLYAGLLRGLIKTRMTIDAVAIAERDRGIAEFCRAICEVLGSGGAFEEAECGTRAEFDIISRRSHRRTIARS